MSAAPWTKTPNWLFEDGWVAELPHAELILCLWLVRLSTGYQQDWCEASESELMAATGLARRSLYRAKRGLVDRGLVAIELRGIRCSYRVTPKGAKSGTGDNIGTGAESGTIEDQCQMRHGCQERHHKGAKSGTGNSAKSGTPPILKKDLKKDLKKTTTTDSTLTPPDDVFFAVAPEVESDVTPVDQADPALLSELTLIGVNEPALSRMLGNPELARSCLRALGAQGAVGSKPAWLVTAFERGGYAVPRSAAELARADREALLQARASARDREAAERAALEQAEAAEWEHLVAGLSPVGLAAIEAEARDSLRPLVGRKIDKVASDAPQIRAAMRELLRARASPDSG